MRFEPLAKLPDARAEQGLSGEGDLEPVVVGRVVAPGDHDPAPDLAGREVQDRCRELPHVHHRDTARQEAGGECVAQLRAGQAAVPADGDPGFPELARLAGDGPSDGMDQLRAQRIGGDAANVVGAKDFRGDRAVGARGSGSGCGWGSGRRHGSGPSSVAIRRVAAPCRAGRERPSSVGRRQPAWCDSRVTRRVPVRRRGVRRAALAGGAAPRGRGLPAAPCRAVAAYRRPVWPNPPAPRFVSENSSTSSKRARATGTTTSWAMRSPGSTT